MCVYACKESRRSRYSRILQRFFSLSCFIAEIPEEQNPVIKLKVILKVKNYNKLQLFLKLSYALPK